MSIPRGTTPTFMLTFDEEGLDFTSVNNVYVTFASKNATVTKTAEYLGIAEQTIEVFLTQADTLQFKNWSSKDDVPVDVQVNWTYTTGKRGASKIKTVVFSRQLLDRVVE